MNWVKPRYGGFKNLYALGAAFVVSILGVSLLAATQAASGPNLYLTASSPTVEPNGEVSVTLHADSGSETVNAVQTSLGFDPAQLQFVSFTEEGPFSQVLASDSSQAGRVRVARGVPADQVAVSGNHPVVTVKFKVLASSGSPAIAFDESSSLLVRNTDSQNILSETSGVTVAVSSTDNATTGRLSLVPAAISEQKDGSFTVALQENSGNEFVNFVQANIEYDKAKLQYVSKTEGSAFSLEAATDTTAPGLIRVGRGIPLGGGGVSGQNEVMKFTFKVLAADGTASLSINKEESMLVTSSASRNILGSVDNSLVTVTAQNPGKPASMSLSPPTGAFTKDATISVAVKATSGEAPLTTAQAVIKYPVSQLEYVNATNSTTFPSALRTNGANGTVDVIRGIAGGGVGVTGTQTLVTLNFKVIGSAGSADLTFAEGSGAYDDTGTGTNVLDLQTSEGASYTISSVQQGCSTDPTAPGRPTATSSSYTSINISWQASAAVDGCVVEGYKVYRGGTLIADVTDGLNYVDTGLTAGTAYNYTVVAYDDSGSVSTASQAAALSTKADDQAPVSPSGVTAQANSAASIALAWTPATDQPSPGGSGVVSYNVYRNGATAPTYTVTDGTSYTDSSVEAGTTYTYTITALDAAGNESAPSNVVSVSTASPSCSGTPTTPGGLGVVDTTMTGTSLQWQASAASEGCELEGYKVYRDGTLVGTVQGTEFTDSGLVPNTVYAYVVRAFDASAHTSAPSQPVSATTAADTSAPSAPGSVTAQEVSAGRITLAWSASTDNIGIASYKLYRNGSAVTTLGTSAVSYSDTSVSGGQDYSYEVSAVDAAGNESAKSAASPTPVSTPQAEDTQKPTRPANVQILAATDDAVSFSWDASTDNVGVAGYKVYRGNSFVTDATDTNFTDSGLNPGTAYSYTVRSFDAAGNQSDASETLAAQTIDPAADNLVGDLNDDDVVNIYDLSILLSHYDEPNVPARRGDLNGDGDVDDTDVALLVNNYGASR